MCACDVGCQGQRLHALESRCLECPSGTRARAIQLPRCTSAIRQQSLLEISVFSVLCSFCEPVSCTVAKRSSEASHDPRMGHLCQPSGARCAPSGRRAHVRASRRVVRMSATVAKPVSVSEKMAQLKEAGRTALIPFIVAGNLDFTISSQTCCHTKSCFYSPLISFSRVRCVAVREAA